MAGKQIIYKGFPFQIITGKPFFLREKSLGKSAPVGAKPFSLPIFSGGF